MRPTSGYERGGGAVGADKQTGQMLKATGLYYDSLGNVGGYRYVDESGRNQVVLFHMTTFVRNKGFGRVVRVEQALSDGKWIKLKDGPELFISGLKLGKVTNEQKRANQRSEDKRRDKIKADVLADYRASRTAGERVADGLFNAGHIDREVKRRMRKPPG